MCWIFFTNNSRKEILKKIYYDQLIWKGNNWFKFNLKVHCCLKATKPKSIHEKKISSIMHISFYKKCSMRQFFKWNARN